MTSIALLRGIHKPRKAPSRAAQYARISTEHHSIRRKTSSEIIRKYADAKKEPTL